MNILILIIPIALFFICIGIGGIIAAYKNNKILNELDADRE